MIRVNIVVEGQTEETFVRDTLAPYLAEHKIFAVARCVATSRSQRGGLRSYIKARNDIQQWLKQDAQAFVSTMFDYHKVPEDFPGLKESRKIPTSTQRIKRLEQNMLEDIGNPRFIPYLQLHEFEALLFSDAGITGQSLGATDRQMDVLQEIRNAFPTPEDINDSEQTAPSKRLLALFPGYTKPAFGAAAVRDIGLDKIRQQCPHFASWLARLESLKA